VIILILALAGGAYAIFSAWGTGASSNTAVVPNVVGLTESQAKKKIEDVGLEYKNAGKQPSADVAEGNVVRQDPTDGEKKSKGSTVSVWISSGKGKVTVPDVVGMTQVDATQALMAKGLKVNAKSETNKDKPVGEVLRQNPAGDAEVDAGATVTIVVVAPSNTVAVPSVLTMNQDAAKALLEGMNLQVKVEMVDSTQTGGTVVDQDPKGSIEVEPNSVVTIYVSNAPLPTTVKVPAVVGLTRSQAVAKLATFSLKASIIYQETPDYPPNQVILQDPTAGVEVEKNSTVQITVTREPVSTTTTTAPPTTTTSTPPSSTDTTLF
jgi:serine/threonine-protein kinase